MPAVLRRLLEAELEAGNGIAEVGHTFPAPPAGAYFLLAKPLLTRPRESGDGIVYYNRKMPSYSGEITDAQRFYFLLEPPEPPEPAPDMDAIRAALAAKTQSPAPPEPVAPLNASVDAHSPATLGRVPNQTELTPRQRFERSMIIDYEKWHDGIGYDLEALAALSPSERKSVEAMLIANGMRDWRDVEALATFDTPASRAVLRAAMRHSDPEIRNAVLRHAPQLVSESTRIKSLVAALQTAVSFGGLGQTLDQVADFHPPPIIEALFRGALERSGDVAVHFAAMLSFIHGKAPVPFDMEQRPFFLRFNTPNRAERETVFRELCAQIQVDPSTYLKPKKGR